jgi:RND family efflux transporter MFP subunit
MRTTIILFLSSLLLVACGGGEDHSDIGKMRQERDSLKAAYSSIGTRLKEIEQWLAENDSTVKRNLPTVTAAPIDLGDFAHYIEVHGHVQADKSAALFAQGRIRKILVQPGDRVSAGQLLITVDNDIVDKQMTQAETALELATTAFERQAKLWEQKIGSEMQYLQAKSQKEQAEAGLAALREQQRLTNVTAPFAGEIDDVMARVGDMASPMEPVARIVNLSGAQLEADVPEGYLRSIKEGAPVKVTFPSLGETFNAKLDHVGNYIDPSNRTFKVTVRMDEGSDLLRPNLLCDISIQDMKMDSAIVVPSRAVLQDVDGNNYIYVLQPGKNDEATARKVMVERMSEYKGRVSISPKEGSVITGNQRIVDEGAKNVTDGLVVRIANT